VITPTKAKTPLSLGRGVGGEAQKLKTIKLEIGG